MLHHYHLHIYRRLDTHSVHETSFFHIPFYFIFESFNKVFFLSNAYPKKQARVEIMVPLIFVVDLANSQLQNGLDFYNFTVTFALIWRLIIIVIFVCLLRQLVNYFFLLLPSLTLFFIGTAKEQPPFHSRHISEGTKYKSNCHKNGNYN